MNKMPYGYYSFQIGFSGPENAEVDSSALKELKTSLTKDRMRKM
jgi:hypothetical protein